jgi:hypothetical protein
VANAQQVDSILIAVDNILKGKENKAFKSNVNNDIFNSEIKKIYQYLSVAKGYKNSNYDSLHYYPQKAIQRSLKLADLESISGSVEMLGDYFIRISIHRSDT